MPSQPEVAKLSPELVQGVTQLARALMAAARNWTLYPPEHPAVRASSQKFSKAIQETTTGAVFSIIITPETLLIEGIPVPVSQPITEAALLLHDRDILQITFGGAVPTDAIHKFLTLLSKDTAALREGGGPEVIWGREGHKSITLEQIDYRKVLEDRDVDKWERRHDDIWRSIVSTIVLGQKTLDEVAQQRLLGIACDAEQVGDLAAAVMASKCAPDGSPLITTQAATVLAAFRHLTSIVGVKAPDQAGEVMRNLASAAATLDPHVVMQMMQSEDDPAESVKVVQGMAAAFDDMKVAQLLATALATEGQATSRLAQVFDTIASDTERKQRVLTLTRTLLSETSFGQSKDFKAIWASMDELLISYNEKPYVSEQYKASLDGGGARSEEMAARDLPKELPEWMDSLGQQNVRTLSVTLIIDLLKLERDAERAAEIADDMTALGEDLLMSGDFPEVCDVTVALSHAAADEAFVARAPCGEALMSLATSHAMHETVGVLGDLDAEQVKLFGEICLTVGPASVDALGATLRIEAETPARLRAADIIVSFRAGAVPRLAPFLDEERWVVQCHAADVLGRIGSPEAVPLLQPLLRRGNPKVLRHAISALAGINDPAAARAIHTVLRTATGEMRRAVIDALVAGRDVRVVPMLVRILDESEPLGKDHAVVLDTLGALKHVHTDNAVRPIAGVMRHKRWFARRRTRNLKNTAVDALAVIGSDASRKALDDAAVSGDRLLRKIVKAKLPGLSA